MVHVFKVESQNYIYDTGSASLHTCDETEASYVKAKYEEGLDIPRDSFIEEELDALRAEGLFEKPDRTDCPLKSSEIKALCLHICHDCNLSCDYCFADEGQYHSIREYMSEEVAIAAIDFLLKNSGKRRILEVDFFGGEPLMNLDVIKNVVSYAREKEKETGKKFLFTTTTNALLLDDDAISFLNREMENVVLSVDGRPEVHDAVRHTKTGRGSFNLVIDNIKKFVSLRGSKNYYVRGTFTAKNLDFSRDVLYLADCGFKNISLEPVVTTIPDLEIKEEHLPKICEEYETLCREYLKRYREGRGFNFFHFNVDLEGGVCLKKKISACGAGNEYYSVVPSGEIYPCHQFAGEKEFLMGDVFSGISRPDIRETFADCSLYTRRGCESCFARFICSGGCCANNYHFEGDIDTPYKITCAMMKRRIECGMHVFAEKKRMREEGK